MHKTQLIVRPNVERELGILPELYAIEKRTPTGSITHSPLMPYDEARTTILKLREKGIRSSLLRAWVRTSDMQILCGEDACRKVLGTLV